VERERGAPRVGGRPLIQPTFVHQHWTGTSLDAVISAASDRFEDEVARVAGGLRSAGVQRGDGVCWQRANDDIGVVLYRACWRIGAVAAPIHHLAGAADVERIVRAVAPRLTLGGDPPVGPPVGVDDGAAAANDAAVVLFTSGSSGVPKGVIHTQGALAYKAKLMATVHGLTADDAILMPAPLAHISGLLNGVLLPGVVPMKAVMMAKWDPARALDVIRRERITFMIGPPTFFVGLLGAPNFDAAAVASLRLVSSGGAGVTPAFVDEASARLGCVVKRTYGSTEAPTITTSQPGDDPERARSTDGRPTGTVELRVDPTTRELLVRGPELFSGYLDAAQNADAFTADGWFRTGDLARLDDGWLTIDGRLKDIIIRGGENIATAEVEATLEAHAAVRQAVAVGVPHERLGEQVVAFVVLTPGASFTLDECRAWFAAQGIATFKTPERVEIVASLPVLAAGKPDRATIREWAIGEPLRSPAGRQSATTGEENTR
jgi:cyclohexanecarboxylate-CoA ligase